MSGPLLHSGAAAQCPHGGALTFSAPVPRVTVSGMPVAVITDPGPVAGCPFQVPAGPAVKPQPCVASRWTVAAARVKVAGQPVLINPSVGLCYSVEQIPGGPPVVTGGQTRVIAT